MLEILIAFVTGFVAFPVIVGLMAKWVGKTGGWEH